MATRIQVRRDLAANWTGSTVLASGEIAYETDTGNVKIGDGSTTWTNLDYVAIANKSSSSTNLDDSTYRVMGRFFLDTTTGSWTNLPTDMTAAAGKSLLLVTRHMDVGSAWFYHHLIQFVTSGSDTKEWVRAYSPGVPSWSAWRSTAHISPNEVVTASIASSAVTYAKLATDVLEVLLPVGSVISYAGSSAPSSQWLVCNGNAVSRSTYAALFALISTTYGSGDGSTTFNLPNLTGRVAVGLNGAGAYAATLGTTGGSANAIVVDHTHTATSTSAVTDPGHRHTFNSQDTTSGGGGGYNLSRLNNNAGTNLTGFAPGAINTNTTGITVATTTTLANTGSSATNANLPPYVTLNYIIRAL